MEKMRRKIVGFIEVGIQTFFWLTVVFAILERTDKGKDGQPYTTRFTKWTPDDLKKISVIPKKKAITKFEVFGSLMWTAMWATFYFYANHLVGVYEGGGERLKFVTPSFNQEVLLKYWPIVLVVIGFEIALAIYKLIKGQWAKRMAIYNAALQLIVSIVFIEILRNPNIMNQDFITYMTNLFTISSKQFETLIVGSEIFIFLFSAAINVYDGFRKARIR